MSGSKINVLVGVDFSEFSHQALSATLKLLSPARARVHLCHIVYSGTFIADTTIGPQTSADLPEAAEALALLQRIRDDLGAETDAEVHVRLSMSPLEGLLGLIAELKPDLVVVGSHGKGLLKRALLGSVSNKLALRSPVPVLIIPAPERAQFLDQSDPAFESECPAADRAIAERASETVF